jgi:hypothetical protein
MDPEEKRRERDERYTRRVESRRRVEQRSRKEDSKGCTMRGQAHNEEEGDCTRRKCGRVCCAREEHI